MADSAVIDQRDESLIQAHSEEAKAMLSQETAQTLKIVEDRKELLTPNMQKLTSAQPQFVYHAMLDFGGFLYAVVEVTLYDWNDRSKRVGHFFGHSGGLVVGAGVTWGTAQGKRI